MLRLDLLYRGGRFLARMFLPTFGVVVLRGQENIPKTGPLLIASNHQSYTDPALLIYAINRPVWWMAKWALFKNPVLAWLLRHVHVFPVEREGKDIAVLAYAQHLLDEGRALMMFPEGTRHPGSLGKGHDGMAYLALRTGVPIIPVAITGTEQIPNVLRTPFHFKRLTAVVGKPYTLATANRIDRALLEKMTDQIMVSIAELLPPEYRGVYQEKVTKSDV